jgi:hypothetical protein
MPTVADMTAVMQAAGSLLRPYPGLYAGKGIVIAGGGPKYFPSAWVCINMLRRHGCLLPIELWHLGSRELSADMLALVEPLGVVCVDAERIRELHLSRILNGWELKPYSVIHSRFREVLYLDADNVPVADPTYLFSTPEYLRHGAVFWPDFGRLASDREVWQLACVEYRDEPEFETGQMLIDKQRCWGPLQLAMWMNEHSDFWYHHIHGDKDTFHMAWRRLGQAYAMPERGIEALDGVMCQHDFSGVRIFQHRNLAKWLLHGNRRISGFMLEDECLGLIEDLRRRWSIVDTLSGGLGSDALVSMQRFGGKRYRYVRVGHDVREIRLEHGGYISEGAAGCEAFWWAKSGEMVIAGADGSITCTLRCTSAGIWEGQWLDNERMPVRLEPVGISEEVPVPHRLNGHCHSDALIKGSEQ